MAQYIDFRVAPEGVNLMAIPYTRVLKETVFCQMFNPVILSSLRKAKTVFGETILEKHCMFLPVTWNVMHIVHYHGLFPEKEKAVEGKRSTPEEKSMHKYTKA